MTYSFDVLIILFSFLPTINLYTILFSIAFSSGRSTISASRVGVTLTFFFHCFLGSFFNFPVPVAASFTIIFWWLTRNIWGI